MSDEPELLEVIISRLEELDDKMTNHQMNCFKCSPGEPCNVWINMMQDYNYYHLAMVREIREESGYPELKLPPGYEG